MSHRDIVVVRYRKGLRTGAVLERSGGKVRVEVDRGRSVTVPAGNILLETGRPAATPGELEAFVREAEARASGLDLEEVWELAVDDGEALGFREIAELCPGGDADPLTLAGVLLRLHSDDCAHFRAGEDGRWHPEARETVEAVLLKRERQRVEAEEEAAFLEWLGSGRGPGPGDMTARQRSWLERVKDLAVHGEEHPGAARGKELIASAGRPGGDARKTAFRRLVKRGIFEPHEHLDLLRLDVPVDFAPEAEAAAAATPADPGTAGWRSDLTHLEAVSIDDETTQDIDDAVSLDRTETGWVLGVHVTELSERVPPGSALDATAAHRTVSHYFPERKLPMLPPALSEGSASLVPEEDRHALSLLVDLDDGLRARGSELVASLVRSRRRLSYDRVDRILAGTDGEDDEGLGRRLALLRDVAEARARERREAGAPDLDRPDVEIRATADGTVDVRRRPGDSPAQRIVSELMVLYNVEVARWARERGVPIAYRTQACPPPEAFEASAAAPHPAVGRFILLRATRPAETTLEPGPHALLGVEPYCQASSPLRRAADLLTQRQVVGALRDSTAPHDRDELARRVYELEERRRELKRLEDDRNRYWLLEWLASRREETFEGVVLEAGERQGQVEVPALALRAGLLLHRPVAPGDVLPVRVAALDSWDGTVRFAPAEST